MSVPQRACAGCCARLFSPWGSVQNHRGRAKSARGTWVRPHFWEQGQCRISSCGQRQGWMNCSKLCCRLPSTFGCGFGCRFRNCWGQQFFGDPFFLRGVLGEIQLVEEGAGTKLMNGCSASIHHADLCLFCIMRMAPSASMHVSVHRRSLGDQQHLTGREFWLSEFWPSLDDKSPRVGGEPSSLGLWTWEG